MHNVILPQTLLTQLIKEPEDVVAARQRARQIMALLALGHQEQIKMTTAVSEIARNAYQYARSGKITYRLLESQFGVVYFEVLVQDHGPGIKQLSTIMQGNYQSNTGQGLGIIGAKRIIDDFSLESTSAGTTVTLRMQVPSHRLPITYVLLSQIANDLAQHRPKSLNEEVEQQNQELLAALEKLTQARQELEEKVKERTLSLAKANESLQHITEQLHLSLQSAQAGAWHWHSHRDHLVWDDYVCVLFGIERGNCINTEEALRNVLHPDDWSIKKYNLREFLQEICCQHGKEFRIRWPDGSLRYIMGRGQIYPTNAQKPQRMSGIFWDITERKQADEWLRQYQLQASHAQRNSSMGEMASALAHELNQPLAAISAFARGGLRRLQVGKATPAQLTDALTEIAEQSERAGEVIHRIKNFVRKGQLFFEKILLKTILTNAIKLINTEMHYYKVKIHFKMDSDTVLINADKIQLEQVFLNLFRNSIEAMQIAETNKPTIRIETCLVDGQKVQIRFKDNGPGFAPETFENLFVPYFTTKQTGMGLGLAICRTIVEAHQGKLTAHSNSSGGACFDCVFPLNLNLD